MSSIEPQIDAAVPLMKERAAQFNSQKTMKGIKADWLINRARENLANAKFDRKTASMRHLVRWDLIDAMNLCALALSLLPEEVPDA